MRIDNTLESFVELWTSLEQTRQLFVVQGRRYCVRRILRSWFPTTANDFFVWKVCKYANTNNYEFTGFDLLPPPSINPIPHRFLIRGLVQASLGLGQHNVRLNDIDKAYSIAFPGSRPINISKKKR